MKNICYLVVTKKMFIFIYQDQYVVNQNSLKQWVSKSWISELQAFKQDRVALQKLQLV